MRGERVVYSKEGLRVWFWQCFPIFPVHVSGWARNSINQIFQLTKMKTNLQKRLSFLALLGRGETAPKSQTTTTTTKPFHFFQLYLSKFLPEMLIYFSQKHYFKIKSLILVHILNINTNLLDFQPNKSSVQSHQSQHQHHFEFLLLEP